MEQELAPGQWSAVAQCLLDQPPTVVVSLAYYTKPLEARPAWRAAAYTLGA